MMPFTLTLTKRQKISLQESMKRAERHGDYIKVKRILAVLMLGAGQIISEIKKLLQVEGQTIRGWMKAYLLRGLKGLRSGKSPGRPSKLTKTERKELAQLIKGGPEASGFSGACWRTPMLQHLINERFGVFYNARYLSELLKNMGFSYQKAKFVASKCDKKARKAWLNSTWKEIMALAKNENSHILFGDEASFPQWGSLSYTWAPVGQQPIVETSGSRKGYKVFGLIDYFTGKFFAKGHEGKLNADSYIDFLQSVLSKTRKHIILIQDGAPYHKGKKIEAFFEENEHRMTVYTLPSYSPDFNPIEMLWKKIKVSGTHLTYFPTFDDLKNKVNEMLNIFSDAKNEVLSLFGLYENLSATK